MTTANRSRYIHDTLIVINVTAVAAVPFMKKEIVSTKSQQHLTVEIKKNLNDIFF